MGTTDFKVIIAGTRDFADYKLLKEKCDAILSNRRDDSNIVIVSGTARGADRLGERYARERGYRIERYPADWDRDGNSAGPIRNAKMADNANALIAFWDGKSRGTKNMIDTAKAKGLMVRTINYLTNAREEQQSSKAQLIEALRAAKKYFGGYFSIDPTMVDLGKGKEKVLTILALRDGGFYNSGTMREITSNIYNEQDIKALTTNIRIAVVRTIEHLSAQTVELDLFGKKEDVNNSGLRPESNIYNINKVEEMKEKKIEASEDKKYQPGDVIEIYEGVKSKYGYGSTAFFMMDEETGVNSWEVGIEGKRIHICVAEGDSHLPAQDMLDKYLPQYRVDQIVDILKARATNDGFTPEQEKTIIGYYDAYSSLNGKERAAGYVLSRLNSTLDNDQMQSAGMLGAIKEFEHLGRVVRGYDAEDHSFFEAPITDSDEYVDPIDERDAVINEKLATLRKSLSANPAYIDAEHPDEAVVDYKVGHYYDGTYALSPVLAKSGAQPPKEYNYEGLIMELNKIQNIVRPEEDPKIKKLREQTTQYAIEHITKKGLHTGYAWLRDAFNDYYDAIKTPGVKISAESDIAHREILAQKVAIDCIHKLNHEQLQQLDKVLKEIVSENNLSNGLRR